MAPKRVQLATNRCVSRSRSSRSRQSDHAHSTQPCGFRSPGRQREGHPRQELRRRQPCVSGSGGRSPIANPNRHLRGADIEGSSWRGETLRREGLEEKEGDDEDGHGTRHESRPLDDLSDPSLTPSPAAPVGAARTTMPKRVLKQTPEIESSRPLGSSPATVDYNRRSSSQTLPTRSALWHTPGLPPGPGPWTQSTPPCR